MMRGDFIKKWLNSFITKLIENFNNFRKDFQHYCHSMYSFLLYTWKWKWYATLWKINAKIHIFIHIDFQTNLLLIENQVKLEIPVKKLMTSFFRTNLL